MYKIDEKLAQKVLDYLARQPYADVWQLVVAIQKLDEIKEKEDKVKNPSKTPTHENNRRSGGPANSTRG